MPHLDTDLMNWPYVVIRIRCDFCARGRDARLAACAAHYGPRCTIQALLDAFRDKCWRHAPATGGRTQKYGLKCTATVLDLGDPGRPPDLPAGVKPLRLVKGGRAYKIDVDNPFDVGPQRRKANRET